SVVEDKDQDGDETRRQPLARCWRTLALRDRPSIEDASCNEEANPGQKKRRNLAHANSNGEICRPPHNINNPECQQGFPRWTMLGGFHSRLLPEIYRQCSRMILAFRLQCNPNWHAYNYVGPSGMTNGAHPYASPNLATDCRRRGHRIAFLATKRAGQFRHIGWRGNGAEAPQWMWVRIHHQALEFRPIVGRPDLRVGKIEALIRCPTADQRGLFPLLCFLQRPVGEVQPTEVGDTLAEHELAVLMNVVLHYVTVELFFNEGSSLVEILFVLRRPPIAQIALRVKLAAFVIEAMRHLVADDGSHRAVIGSVIRFRIEKRRLQNSSGKNDLVHFRIVISVHCRRRHAPLGAVDGLSNFVQVALEFKLGAAHLIERVRTAIHREG